MDFNSETVDFRFETSAKRLLTSSFLEKRKSVKKKSIKNFDYKGGLSYAFKTETSRNFLKKFFSVGKQTLNENS